MSITIRLAALFGSRRRRFRFTSVEAAGIERAADDARKIVRLARKIDRINVAISNGSTNAQLAHEPDRIAARIGQIAKPYLRRDEKFVYRSDPRGPAVRLITKVLERLHLRRHRNPMRSFKDYGEHAAYHASMGRDEPGNMREPRPDPEPIEPQPPVTEEEAAAQLKRLREDSMRRQAMGRIKRTPPIKYQ